ncbi:MAG: C10 family peptidase, partial [Candidatus Cloacimonetes bacterium]|nr:C10 family peptidase [Candidatus Cloacimonadota bacterium]
MKTTKLFLSVILFAMCLTVWAAEPTRSVDPLILPEWHQTNPWNGRCPGTGPNRAHAGSHALALAKTMKYWAYPTYGTGSVSYVDDDYGPIFQNFTADINWSGMSNTLVFQTTLRFIYMVGASAYTNYEVDYSTSTLANVQSALINNFSYAGNIMFRNRTDFTNFYWKSMIREELDNARPVIYAVTVSSGAEVAFIIDGYNDEGLFHINWSDDNYPNSWVDLNSLTVWNQAIANNNQRMLTGIMPSLGPDNIDENFETDFTNFNWQFSGHQNWSISSESAFYGSQSAKTGNINDNQTTSMFIQINVTNPDTISFFKKVSCESEPNHSYDHLAFFIDNVEQERWSGDGNWAYHEYTVSPGLHTFRWTYSKDGASTYFSDCAWVDAIDFPEGTTPLNEPLFVEAEVSLGNQITLNWQAPQGASPTLTGYKIFRNGVSIAQFNNPTMSSYIDYNMPNGDYTYFLRAVYTEGLSNPSTSTTVTVEVPYAPTNLTATLTGVNTATLAWQAPPLLRNRALMGYYIYRDDVLIAQLENPLAVEYDDPGLDLGVYYYEISALYQTGESDRSNVAQIAIGVPEPPSNLRATVVGSTVNLAWNQVSDTTFLTGFKVFRNGVMVATINNPNQLSFSDTNLLNGAYSYYVRAVYVDVDSGNSSTVHVVVEVAYPPTNVTTIVTGDDVQINWVNPVAVRALTHYYVYRNNQVIAAVFNPNTTSYQDQNLPNGLYTYKVSAFYSGIESPLSAPATALVEVLYPPTNLTASVSLADVHLNWVMPVVQGGLTRSFNGYNIYRNGVLVHFVTPGTITSYTDSALNNGTYNYAVTALYSSGESTSITVNNVVVEVLYPITSITHVVTDDDVLISWQAAATSPNGRSSQTREVLRYNVYKEGVFLSSTTDLSYSDNNLANGVYHYYVKVQYVSGESTASPTVTATVEVLYPPTNLQGIAIDNDVQLVWNVPATFGGLSRGLLGYRVYRDGALIASPTSPVYNDNNLPNGLYDYQVFARYSSGISAPTDMIQVLVEVLYAPNQLSISVSNHNDISLNWQITNRSVLGYQVFRNNSLIAETPLLTFADNNMADGNYSYKVCAVYGSGISPASNTVSAFIEFPYPPQNIVATVNQADVLLSWQVVPGTSVVYHIYRDGVLISSTSNSFYNDPSLNNGSYDYFLTSSNASDSGVSDASGTVTATVNVLYPPQNLSGSVTGDDVTLYWIAPANGPRDLLGYNVYRNGAFLATTSQTSYLDNNLSNETYSYYVTAIYTSQESAASNTIHLMVEVMYPPTGLSANVIGDDVYLTWTAAATSRAIQGYKVYRDNVEIAQTNLPSYVDSNLANGTYYYFVKAVYIGGISEPTSTVEAIVEVLYPPSGLSYSIDDDDILLSWQAAPQTGASRSLQGYKIYRNGSLLTQVNSLSYTDASLANGVYQYYVSAVYTSGESSNSETVVVNLEVLYPATNLSYQVSGDDVSLSWNIPVTSGGLRNLLGYKVLRNGLVINQVVSNAYSDNNLANGIYTYSIIAVYSSGEANPTESVEVLVEVLYPASNLTYQVVSDSVILSWNAAPNSARALLGYKVYRDGILQSTVTELTYSDVDLANGSYTYYVTALYGPGESVASNIVTATVEVLYPVTNLQYIVNGDDVTLSWILPAVSGGLRNLIGYKVKRDGVLIATTSELNYTDNNLTNGIYQYNVSVVYDSGESTVSPSVEVLVEVLYPAANLYYQVTADDVNLSWSAAPNSA